MSRVDVAVRSVRDSHLLAFIKRHRLALRVVGMIVLLAIALSRVDLAGFVRDLAGANLGILAGSVAVAFLGWAINSYKWQRLLRASGVRRSLTELFQLNLIAIFY